MKTIINIAIAIVTFATSATANNNNPAPAAATVLNASVNNNAVVLSWSSAKNSTFEIERSFYSNNFTAISTLQVAFSGNTINNISINDNAAELAGRKIAYYRVKQTNADGAVSYSNTTIVNLESTEVIPVKKVTMINFASIQNGNAVINVKSVTGQTVATTNTLAAKGYNRVAVTNIADLSKGIYVVETSVNGVVVDTQKVIAE